MSQSDIHDLYEQYKTSKKTSNNHEENVPLNQVHLDTIDVRDWAKDVVKEPVTLAKNYARSLFPIHRWILHYNFAWLYADVVAGVTVGVVMVPQSMSYAQLAGLEAQYGLYSAFVGVFIYCFFATSKDVSIGPVAVMSLEVSKVISRVQKKNPDASAPEIATILSLLCGSIALGIGLLRLGFILEFISIPAVVGFMTGSAFSIICGQVPALMGYNKLVNTRAATYEVVVNTLKNLPHTNLDAVFGLIPLLILYSWKFFCNWAPTKWPKLKLPLFYLQALRHGVVIVVFTCISWGMIRHNTKKTRISILGTVPSGLRDVGPMTITEGIVKDIAPELPAATIILLLEHISISKSFGRINDYKIVPDQELVAIGVTNLIGTFFNAYPATGSFSRSALKAKCNVKTPLAGIYTGACVLLALYALTDAFYFIPKATLSAIIIHAVSDLLASYHVTWNFWKVAPLDAGIFLVCVLITVFSSIENGIYFAMCASVAVLLFNVAFPNGEFLGRVKVAEVINPELIQADDSYSIGSSSSTKGSGQDDVELQEFDIKEKSASTSAEAAALKNRKKDLNIKYHTKWLPFKKETVLNSQIVVQPPHPGLLVYKPAESWTYLNCSRQYDAIFDGISKQTRRGKPLNYERNIDRPWNNPGPLRWSFFGLGKKKHTTEEVEDTRPVLKTFVFDFTNVNQVDITSIQTLVDLRKAVNKYADHEVEFHFVGVLDPWIRRALINAGFGGGAIPNKSSNDVEANIEDVQLSDQFVDVVKNEESLLGYVSVIDTNTPFFHLDIPDFDYLEDEVEEK